MQAAETNKKNAESSPGSVSGVTTAESSITQADIDAHANDRSWVRKNFEGIQKFYNLKG
jgi:hypothetical protein